MLAPADPLTATGYNDVHGQAAVIPATVINSYSSLAIPAWFRAVNLLSSTLASLPRRVVKDGTEPGQPHYHPDALLRGSTKDQVVVTTAVNAGVETANEGRGCISGCRRFQTATSSRRWGIRCRRGRVRRHRMVRTRKPVDSE